MARLDGTQTEANLRAAFTAKSETNRRYLYFAQQADIEGQPETAALFRSLAEAETGHAFGHLDILAQVGDPATGRPVETAQEMVRSAIESETRDATERYPEFAAVARAEGFDEIADWLDSVANADRAQVAKLNTQLD